MSRPVPIKVSGPLSRESSSAFSSPWVGPSSHPSSLPSSAASSPTQPGVTRRRRRGERTYSEIVASPTAALSTEVPVLSFTTSPAITTTQNRSRFNDGQRSSTTTPVHVVVVWLLFGILTLIACGSFARVSMPREQNMVYHAFGVLSGLVTLIVLAVPLGSVGHQNGGVATATADSKARRRSNGRRRWWNVVEGLWGRENLVCFAQRSLWCCSAVLGSLRGGYQLARLGSTSKWVLTNGVAAAAWWSAYDGGGGGDRSVGFGWQLSLRLFSLVYHFGSAVRALRVPGWLLHRLLLQSRPPPPVGQMKKNEEDPRRHPRPIQRRLLLSLWERFDGFVTQWTANHLKLTEYGKRMVSSAESSRLDRTLFLATTGRNGLRLFLRSQIDCPVLFYAVCSFVGEMPTFAAERRPNSRWLSGGGDCFPSLTTQLYTVGAAIQCFAALPNNRQSPASRACCLAVYSALFFICEL